MNRQVGNQSILPLSMVQVATDPLESRNLAEVRNQESRAAVAVPNDLRNEPGKKARRTGTGKTAYRCLKRLVDVGSVLVVSPLLVPALVAIAAIVRIDSRGPIFFRQTRIGQGGSRFVMLKFRTMSENSEGVLQMYLRSHPDINAEWQRTHKLRYDPRITRVGRFLRQYSLDEIPQLWNVLTGEMTLVGPRPIVIEEIKRYGKSFACYRQVKPGITGLWQVSGRSHVSYPERVKLDCKYVDSSSASLDLKILWRTISAVISRHGAF